MTRRAMITGGGGFIGSHLVDRLLADDYDVRVVERPGADNRHLPLDRIELLEVDIRDQDAMMQAAADCELVLHLAANPNLWARNADEFEQVNHQGTRNVLAAAKAAGAHRTIYVSTESILAPPGSDRIIDEDTVTRLVHDPNTLTGPTDSGAHGQLFCGAGSQLHLLTHYVRNRGTVSIEQMVHALTGKIANYYGFVDRGVIAPGKVADLAVFGIDEIELRPEKRVEDVPDGRGGLIWRYTRDPAPMRTTIVGGVPIFDVNKGFLGVFPGGLIGPSQAA